MEPFQLHNSYKHQLLLQPWMTLDNKLTAGFTTRNGGVSEEPYHTFNIGLHVNDRYEHVIKNRELLMDSLGFTLDEWVSGEQIHHNQIAFITKEDCGKGSQSVDTAIKGVDGLLTNERNVILTSFYADCVPLYFWDPELHVIGLAHAGWKGTVTAIALHMIEKMKAEYSCNIANIRCAIGPAIEACCYEVNEVVIERIDQLWQQLELPDDKKAEVIQYTDPNHAYIHLKEINRQIMIKAGIMASHIELSDRCTGCEQKLFYSHRKEGGRTGRMASWIGLRKEG